MDETEADRQARLPPYVRLINEISVQFPELSADDAATAVAAHVRRFWDPRLRSSLSTHLTEGGADLRPIARDAAILLQSA